MSLISRIQSYLENIVDAFIYFDQKTKFKSSGPETHVHGITVREWKKTGEVKASQIPIYPRVSLFDRTQDNDGPVMFFDSSDFIVINSILTDSIRHIKVGKVFKYEETRYRIEEIQVHVLDSFDDYSTKFRNGTNHSEVYLGDDVPYNMQVQVFVKRAA